MAKKVRYRIRKPELTTVALKTAQHKRLRETAFYLNCSLQRAVHDAVEWWIAYQQERIRRGVTDYGTGIENR